MLQPDLDSTRTVSRWREATIPEAPSLPPPKSNSFMLGKKSGGMIPVRAGAGRNIKTAMENNNARHLKNWFSPRRQDAKAQKSVLELICDFAPWREPRFLDYSELSTYTISSY